jgi:hypothetical protein
MADAPSCPYCEASSYRLRDERWLVCQECGHEFDVQRDVCLVCGHLNPAEGKRCIRCGAPLRRDVADRVIQERGRDRQAWIRERLSVDASQVERDRQASQQRMEAYWAEERALRAAQAEARARQRARERKMLILVGALGALLILALVLIALLTSLGETPHPAALLPHTVLGGGQPVLWALPRMHQTAPV